MGGLIQNEDIKSAAELVSAGGTAAQLPNDTKIWMTAGALAKSLYQTFVDGIVATQGGTGQTTYSTGDILYSSATNVLSKLAATTNGYILTLVGGVPAWQAASSSTPADSTIRVSNSAGNGSTNTTVRYFSNTISATGSDISYNNSSTNGDTFTINTTGRYQITYADASSGGFGMGISLNSSQLSTSIFSITTANRLVCCNPQNAQEVECVSWGGYLTAGDVIRAQTDGSGASGVPARTSFTISRIA